MKQDLSTIGGRINYVVLANNMTQLEFSKRTGIPATSVSLAINGSRKLGQKAIDAILDSFKGEFDANWLIRGEGEPPYINKSGTSQGNVLESQETGLGIGTAEYIKRLEEENQWLRKTVDTLTQSLVGS